MHAHFAPAPWSLWRVRSFISYKFFVRRQEYPYMVLPPVKIFRAFGAFLITWRFKSIVFIQERIFCERRRKRKAVKPARIKTQRKNLDLEVENAHQAQVCLRREKKNLQKTKTNLILKKMEKMKQSKQKGKM